MRAQMMVAALAMASSLAIPVAAYADDNFSTDQVSIAYSDGYMGVDHQFHAWEHRADAEAFRAKFLDRYHPWRHDDPQHANAHE